MAIAFDASWQVESYTNVSSSETPSAAALGITANGSDICDALAMYYAMSWELMHVHTHGNKGIITIAAFMLYMHISVLW